MKLTFGLDFGTTNSSLSVSDGEKVWLVKVDEQALDPRVVRSMVYFARRQLKYKQHLAKTKILNQYFDQGDIYWEGEQKILIGSEAVSFYLQENVNRQPGVKRIIFTGRIINTETLEETKGGAGSVREYYEEVDYGTGRLLQAIKSALKTSFGGTTIFGKYYTVEDLIGVLLGAIKRQAENNLRLTINDIRVGRPVVFSLDPEIDKRAQDRLETGLKKAGFEKVTFQYEPVAAAKSYLGSRVEGSGDSNNVIPAEVLRSGGTQDRGAEIQKKSGSRVKPGMTKRVDNPVVLVFDFGGGTLDTALLRGDQVLSVDGVYIGGDLLNADIMRAKLWDYFGYSSKWGDLGLPMPNHLYEALGSWYSIPNLNNPNTVSLIGNLKYKNTNPYALDRLVYLIKMNLGFEIYEAIEEAKKILSQENTATINFSHGPIDISQRISREDFEAIIKPRVDEVRKVVLETLKKAKVEPQEVDQVIRTGGSSLIPAFENMLIELFGQDKISLFDTFTSIASGLAIT